MKPLYIIVEGITEKEFCDGNIVPFLAEAGIYEVRPILIRTKGAYKGGFVNYEHLKRDAENYLKQRKDCIVSTFVDYFRIPVNLPRYAECQTIFSIDERINCLEAAMKTDIGDERFFPYIQKHEFEALLFSSNRGFEYCYDRKVSSETAKIIGKYANPEEINDHPNTSPSNRLKTIVPLYNKVLDGNTIALEVGLADIIEKCPRFKTWLEMLIDAVRA